MWTEKLAHLPGEMGISSLQQHLTNVAKMAEEFMPDVLYKSQAFYTGLWHDLGKYSPRWQKRLFQVSQGKRPPIVGHAHQGAFLAARYGLMAALCIYGHHRGLPDRGEFRRWYVNPDRKNTATSCEEAIAIARLEFPEAWFFSENQFFAPTDWEEFDLMTRFLFSALIDADYTDTSIFYGATYPSLKADWNGMIQSLEWSPSSPVEVEGGLFCVCYPSPRFHLAALKFGLFHAQEHSFDRIIYAVPRAMLTQEVAREYKKLLGEESVLEHHTTLAENKTTYEQWGLLRLTSQNWNYPIIVTTVEQLLESLFSNRPEDCRKVHNFTSSLIVFEEIQFLPVGYMNPVMSMLQGLVQYGKSSVVLGSINPYIHDYFEDNIKLTSLNWLDSRYSSYLYTGDYRCFTEWGWEQVAEDIQVRKVERVLIVCHSAIEAQQAYSTLAAILDNCYCLSTLMCSAHCQFVLENVRQSLSAKSPTFLITHILGSNFDIAFPHAYLSMPPLEIIRQVTISFELRESLTIFSLKHGDRLLAQSEGRRETQILLSQGLSLKDYVIDQEYIWHRRRGKTKDQQDIQKMRQLQQFRSTSQSFRLKPDTVAIFVPYDAAAIAVLKRLESKPNWSPTDFLSIQPYLISVSDDSYLAETRNTKQGLLVWMGAYCPSLGLLAAASS
jgi:CRISPR-associated endonuclease/helicase Cas3